MSSILIGIIATIIIAAISSQSGKKNVHPNVSPETQPDEYQDLEPYLTNDYHDQYHEQHETPEPESVGNNENHNLESYRPATLSLETQPQNYLEAQASTYLPLESATEHGNTSMPVAKKETKISNTDDLFSEFDLRKAVIYNELLQPKFKQY